MSSLGLEKLLKNMLDRNSIPIGLIIGFLLPTLGYLLLIAVFMGLDALELTNNLGFSENFRTRTLGIVAICLNIFPLNFFQKRRATQSMRGVVIATSVFVIAWLAVYGKSVF